MAKKLLLKRKSKKKISIVKKLIKTPQRGSTEAIARRSVVGIKITPPITAIETPTDKPLFFDWTEQDYVNRGIKSIKPMTAKEPLDDKMLETMLEDDSIIAEDKLDGTRQLMHIFPEYSRLFSRNVSKVTHWYTENTDRLPHLRDLKLNLGYTVLDGELKIPNKPFETSSSILNCLPKEAIERQAVEGKIVLNVFDILWYDGKCVEDLPLTERKELLGKVVARLDSKYVVECQYFTATKKVKVSTDLRQRYFMEELYSPYPNLHGAFLRQYCADWDFSLTLNKKEYYEFVVAMGGEGVMLKNPDGKYFHKRGREYTKYKKFLTRDVIALWFNEPTREYEGKSASTWGYWVDQEDNPLPYAMGKDLKKYKELNYTQVTKPYYHGWVGNLEFGVVVTDEDVAYLKTANGKKFKDLKIIEIFDLTVLVVGECSGFDDVSKDKYTKNPNLLIGSCVEVRCNEVFKKTGKLRHPRFMRKRKDKNIEECIFVDHVQSDGKVNE